MLSLLRYLKAPISEDLMRKMVFIAGPRQVGKTTFALKLFRAKNKNAHFYYNWDNKDDRLSILKNKLFLGQKKLILDEIHKYTEWKNFVKGLYDRYGDIHKILVTGSARLNTFLKGGDSMLGRYHFYRLHPLSLPEMTKQPVPSDLEQLFTLGGFPEPLLEGTQKTWRRWQKERNSLILNEDLQDLMRVKEIALLELLLDILPERVGSPLSLESLKEDLGVAHQTVASWVTMFDNLYLTFRLSPYGYKTIRAVTKEQKLYFWDWSQVQEPGVRFENMVASHLLKYCHYHEDTQGFKMELKYIRDTDKREVDFVVVKDKKPLFAVECKLTEKALAPGIKYFAQRLTIPKYYQVHMGTKDFGDESTGRVLPFAKFCELEKLV